MAQTQAERARNYRKRRAEERAKARANDVSTVKASRAVTREAKRDRARADRVERAAAILEQPVPPRADLLDEALRTLRSVALDAGAAEASRVGAGRALVAWASGRTPGEGRGVPGSQSGIPGEPSSEIGGGDGKGPAEELSLEESLQ